MTDTSSQFLLPVASPDSYNTSIPRMQLLLKLSPGVLAGIVLGDLDADPPHRSGCVLLGRLVPRGRGAAEGEWGWLGMAWGPSEDLPGKGRGKLPSHSLPQREVMEGLTLEQENSPNSHPTPEQ